MLRRSIEKLGPYQSLALLAIPVSLVEPLKLVAVAVVGAGHWIAGTVTIVCAYAISLLLIERLFKIVKPKILSLPWFARCWHWFTARRDNVIGWLRFNSFRSRIDEPLQCKKQPLLDFKPDRRMTGVASTLASRHDPDQDTA